MSANKHVLITGGCGFIGSNLTARLLSTGYTVTVLDNLRRRGSEINRNWLVSLPESHHLRIIKEDVRQPEVVLNAAQGADVIFHLAAQVAVTTSISNPREDFEINALSTLNVLEAARLSKRRPLVVYTSTNKVYGGMEDVTIEEHPSRYAYRDLPYGVSEDRPLDFHSPYSCSKGCADQYVRDYSRMYGIPTVVLRMSCIYGPHQFGNEDQGWIAHFVISALNQRAISIYGDGKQVRDVLFVGDLVDLFCQVLELGEQIGGTIFNIGGGPDNTISIWREFGTLLKDLTGYSIPITYGDWRCGDQKVYISDIRKAQNLLGWHPVTSLVDGIQKMLHWLQENVDDMNFSEIRGAGEG